MEHFCMNNTCTPFKLLKVQRGSSAKQFCNWIHSDPACLETQPLLRGPHTSFWCVLAFQISPSALLFSCGISIRSFFKKTSQACSEIFHLGTYFLKHINPNFLKTTLWEFWCDGRLWVCFSWCCFFLLIQLIDVSEENLTGLLGSYVVSGWCSLRRGRLPHVW